MAARTADAICSKQHNTLRQWGHRRYAFWCCINHRWFADNGLCGVLATITLSTNTTRNDGDGATDCERKRNTIADGVLISCVVQRFRHSACNMANRQWNFADPSVLCPPRFVSLHAQVSTILVCSLFKHVPIDCLIGACFTIRCLFTIATHTTCNHLLSMKRSTYDINNKPASTSTTSSNALLK